MCCVVLCCAVLCCAVLCCVVLFCVVLCCSVLCCAVLCCVVLCCVVLCCAVLCCAVLCCAVLCGADTPVCRLDTHVETFRAPTNARIGALAERLETNWFRSIALGAHHGPLSRLAPSPNRIETRRNAVELLRAVAGRRCLTLGV